MSRQLARLIALVGILMISATELLPHHHEGAFELSFVTAANGGEMHAIRCNDPRSATFHFHADRVRQIDPCVACLRQHMKVIASGAIVRIPQPLLSVLVVAAPIANVDRASVPASSRAPPLAS
jgi:hypothetical protein